MTEYRGALTEDDFVEIVRLRRRVIREAGTFEDATVWFGVGFLVLAGWGYTGGNPESLWWLPFSLLCFAVWWRRRVDPRTLWRREAALRDEFRGLTTEQALEARLGGIDTRVPWTFFSSHVASSSALLLFAGSKVHVMLSRSMFGTDDAWQQARATIAQRVPQAREEHGTSPRRLLISLGWVLLLLLVFLAWHFAQIPKK